MTDVAKADDAECLTSEFCQWCVPITEVRIGRPFSCAILNGIVLCAVGDGKQMSKHHLSDTLRAIGRYIGDDDAVLMGRLNIHHVVARCQHTDVFQFGQLFDFRAFDQNLVGQNDFRIFCPMDGLFGFRAVINSKFSDVF